MDTNLTTTEDTQFQDALDTMPEEVRDYMWSPAFDYAIDVAEKVLELSPQEKEYVRDAAYDLLMRLIDMETAANKLIEQKVAPEKVSKIMYYLDQEIIQSATNLVNYYGDINEIAKQDTQSTKTIDTATPSTTLSRLQESFVKPTSLAPTTRDHSALPTSAPAPSTPRAIDPYRELPDEK